MTVDEIRELIHLASEAGIAEYILVDVTGQFMPRQLLLKALQPDGTWIEHDLNRLRQENEHLLSERNQLLRERNELQRRLDGARANISRLHERRVQELFPDGPGKEK